MVVEWEAVVFPFDLNSLIYLTKVVDLKFVKIFGL